MKRAMRIGLYIIAGVALLALGYDLSVGYIWDGGVDVIVRINAPVPVRLAEYEHYNYGNERSAAEGYDLLATTGYLENPATAGTNPCKVFVWTSGRESGLKWSENSHSQRGFIVLRVELENGERWAVLVRAPDVRQSRETTVTIPGPDARQITAPKPVVDPSAAK